MTQKPVIQSKEIRSWKLLVNRNTAESNFLKLIHMTRRAERVKENNRNPLSILESLTDIKRSSAYMAIKSKRSAKSCKVCSDRLKDWNQEIRLQKFQICSVVPKQPYRTIAYREYYKGFFSLWAFPDDADLSLLYYFGSVFPNDADLSFSIDCSSRDSFTVFRPIK